MIASSPAGRVRGRFMSFGIWGAALAFAVIEGDALLDQSEIGHASILFMVGTACLAAAGCLALFAFITAIGVVVSAAFSEEPLHSQSADPAQDASAAAAPDGEGSPTAGSVGSRAFQVLPQASSAVPSSYRH